MVLTELMGNSCSNCHGLHFVEDFIHGQDGWSHNRVCSFCNTPAEL